jgi:hypothetical protein
MACFGTIRRTRRIALLLTAAVAAMVALGAGPVHAAPPPGQWENTLNEEFNGTSLNTNRWTTLIGGTSNNDAGKCISPNSVSVSGGYLRLKLKNEYITCGGSPTLAGGTIDSVPGPGREGFTYTYGYVEWGVNLPGAFNKTSPQGWPCPTVGCIANWPQFWSRKEPNGDSEIDQMESLQNIESKRFGVACYHFHGFIPSKKERGGCADNTGPGAHTFASDWEPGQPIKYYYDGVLVGEKVWEDLTEPGYFENQSLIGSYTEPVDIRSPLVVNAEALVDYVKVWQRPKPTVTTDTASEVGQTTAKLNGSVFTNGLPTSYYFEYGKTTAYGSTFPAPPGTNLGNGPGYNYTWNNISGLVPGTIYHYRVVATNATGTSYGADQAFTTTAAPAGLVEPFALRDSTSGKRWVFYRGDDGALWQWASGASWGHTRIGGAMASNSSPSAQRASTGTIWSHFVGTNGAIWEAVSTNNGETWPSLSMLGAGGGQPAAAGTSPVDVRETNTSSAGNMWVYYVGTDNAIWQWRWDNTKWTNQRITSVGAVAPGTSPSVERNFSGTTMWVHYVGSNGAIWEAVTTNNGETWPSISMLGAGAGQPAAASSPVDIRETNTSSAGNMWVYYTGTDNSLWQWRWDNTKWTNTRVSSVGAVAPGASPSVERNYAGTTMWVHFTGSNNAIWEAVTLNNGETWPSISMLGAGAGESAAPNTSSVTLRDPATNNQWVYYIGAGKWIDQWAWDGTSWNMSGLGRAAGANAKPFAMRDASSGNRWVFYGGDDQALWQWKWNGSVWGATRVGGAIANGTSPTVQRSAAGSMWAHFVGTNGAIWEAWSGNNGDTWPSISMLGAGSGQPAAAGTSPVDVRENTTGTANQWVYYVGTDNAIWQWRWDNTKWTNTRITSVGAVAPGTSPTVERNYTGTTMWVH